jgi:hypothetical protein
MLMDDGRALYYTGSALPIAYYGKGSESLNGITGKIPPQFILKCFDPGLTNLSVLISFQWH